jgi:hypothetical protein
MVALGEQLLYSLECHRTLDVCSEIHNLFADGGDESMGGVFLGKVVPRDGEDQVGALGSSGYTEYRAREEHSVRLGRGETFQCASGRRVNL